MLTSSSPTPTAPPTTANISFPKPIVLGAKPVCNPGLPAAVPLAAPGPAVPLGTESLGSLAATTVTAVTVDRLPSGKVVIRLVVVVWDGARRVEVAEFPEPDEPPPGGRVFEPPPTVVTIVTPCAFTLVTTWPELRVPVVRAPWALVNVATAPAVSELASSVAEAAATPALESDTTAPALVLAPGARGEVLVESTVVGALSDDPGATEELSVTGVPSVGLLVAVAIGATGDTNVVAEAEFGTSVLLSPGTIGAADVVTVPLPEFCRLANATMLLATDASSLCRASAAVLSFSNMPCVNFLGE